MKGVVLDRLSNKYVHSTASSDSEKAANDTNYPTPETRLSIASLRSEIPRHSYHASLSSTSKPRMQDMMISHSRTMSLSFRAPSRRNSADMTTTLSLQAGVQCVSRRTRQEHLQDLESKTFASTPSSNTITSEFTDSLAFQSVAGSSKTSIVTVLGDSLYAEDDDLEDEEQYEVQRVQTQSMEIQRGVLVACRASNVPSVLPPIWENPEAASRCSQALSLPDHDYLIAASAQPSATSLASSFSIDLADFPLPPISEPHVSLGFGNDWERMEVKAL